MVVGVNWLNVFQECRRAVFWAVTVPSVHLEILSILENKLIGYDDDSNLMGGVPSPGVTVTVAESLIRDLCRVSE